VDQAWRSAASGWGGQDLELDEADNGAEPRRPAGPLQPSSGLTAVCRLSSPTYPILSPTQTISPTSSRPLYSLRNDGRGDYPRLRSPGVAPDTAAAMAMARALFAQNSARAGRRRCFAGRMVMVGAVIGQEPVTKSDSHV
jgi:hypothetical protein